MILNLITGSGPGKSVPCRAFEGLLTNADTTYMTNSQSFIVEMFHMHGNSPDKYTFRSGPGAWSWRGTTGDL